MYEKFLLEKKRYGLKEEISEEEKTMIDKGIPFQKIIGFINFDDVRINVNRNVLIPRYETQEVLEEALKHIGEKSDVLDLCCGSGYLGLSIKKKTNANVTMSDIEDEAILQSKENAQINNLNVDIIKSDLFKNINKTFDVIVSNPPYIPKKNILDKSVLEFEPHNALFADEDGNYFYKKILNNISTYLKKGGWLIFEISPDNLEFIKAEGFKIINDINGKERIAIKQF